MITENLSTLKINKLTQEQYDRELDAGNIDETALYLTPDESVLYTEQALTEEQKAQARKNIDASGIYVGSGEMPDGYSIQIDPNGDILSSSTFLTYTPQPLSKGAQAQAMENIGASTFYHTTRETLDAEHGDTDKYANADYIWGLYDALMAEYPDEVQKKEVQNNDGTFTNYVYEISTREYPTDGLYADAYEADPQIKKPKYLILSGIHGDERKTCLSTYKFIRDVLRGHNVPQSFREGVTLCVMPVGTPSAINAFNRPSENAVDINRNFDWHWVSETKTDELYGTFTYGTTAASEKETQAIVNWLASHTDAELFIDYHNSGQINEQVVIMGLADTQKKIAMRGIDRIIPYWKDVIGYPKTMALSSGEYNTIFSYTATAEIAGAHCYAQEVLGINSLAMETAVFHGNHADFLANRNLCPPETIAMGAEALGNILIEFYENEVSTMLDANKKLDALLQAASFHIVTGTSYTFDGTNFCIPLSKKPKMVIWRATDDTQKKISAKVKAGKDNTQYYTIGGIMNFAKDIDTTSYMYTELNKNYNSFLACYQYYNATVDFNPAKETRCFYEDGYAKIPTLNFSKSFDDGATPAEYEWTAYYWDE